MKTIHVHEELSAYIDGQADTPGDIELHLNCCADCARHHRELLWLSAHIQALAHTDSYVGSEFVSGVLSRVASGPEVISGRRWVIPAQLALAAALLLVGGLAVYERTAPEKKAFVASVKPLHSAPVGSAVDHGTEPILIPNANVPTDGLAPEARIVEASLETQVDSLVAQGVDVSLLEGSLTEENTEIPSVPLDDVVGMLAASSINDSSVEQVYSDSGPASLDSYSKDDLDALQVYLQNYKQTNKG